MRASTSPSTDLRRIALGAGLLAGTANVIMQLGHPAVGHGVVESKVDSGNVFKHPVKRLRTTLAYLAVATMGTDEERGLYRRAVNRSHVQVRSDADSPVSYNAFDPDLQLWVAACLYRGFEDVYRLLGMRLDPGDAAEIYRRSAVLGTTLQVPAESWPADREAFERYWDDALGKIHIDDTVRGYLTDLTAMRNLPRPVQLALGRFNRFVTTGFLPPRFREEMRFDWDPSRQRGFERLMSAIGVLVRLSPPVLRAFPFNAVLWDLRRRVSTGRPLV
ncbi:oxygenase MpaB family protein [Pseudonocardia acaciae]|uniref:oxygenase MpaB family protein n=1 Tax=Pseudonocardia acaciae TaxID=551276 RepID=UPI000491D393|nr:oxygenase MpaB family protein [Pseudonocardia acaciae]